MTVVLTARILVPAAQREPVGIKRACPRLDENVATDERKMFVSVTSLRNEEEPVKVIDNRTQIIIIAIA